MCDVVAREQRRLKGRSWNPSYWALWTDVSPTGLFADLTTLDGLGTRRKSELAADRPPSESESRVLEPCTRRTPAEVHWWGCWPSERENMVQTEI